VSNSRIHGINALGLLGVAFVVLKLLGQITWSWWWVTAPFWAIPVIFVVGFIITLIVLAVLDWRAARRRTSWMRR
jgi:ABC-type antimicrobial peptide transport system permease subunit